MDQRFAAKFEMLDLEGNWNVEYLEGDLVSLDLHIPHLSNCYLRPLTVLILEFEDMTSAWILKLPAWGLRLHKMVRVTE